MLDWFCLKSDVWVPILTGFGGVALGAGITWVRDRSARKARHKTYCEALLAEARICQEYANTYLTAGIQAPSYRLPNLTYLHCLPPLLADGALRQKDTDTLTRFFNQVQTINRGLDQVADAHHLGKKDLLDQEWKRNEIKCKALVTTFYPSANALLSSLVR